VSSEQTLILIKPDGVKRGLVGEVIARIERKGYVVTNLKMLTADRALLAKHYAEHEGKPFYEPLLEFMQSGPIVAMIAQGERVIEGFRKMAARDMGTKVVQNIVHGSDSTESAQREIKIFFGN